MGCVYDGGTFLIQTLDPLKYSVTALRIDRHCRFIEEYKFWLMRYSAGNIQSSQQSTRELLWKEFPVIRNIHEIHCLLNTFASLLFVLYIEAAEVINILIYSQFIEHRHILHYNSDLSLDIVAVGLHLFAKYLYIALVKCEQRQYTIYSCRFAGAVWSKESKYLPRLHRQTEMIQRQ